MVANPALVRAYKTAVFKVHDPSRRKRAMLDDALRRAHFAYSKALRIVLADLEQYAAMKPRERMGAVEKRVSAIVKPLPIGIGAKASIAMDVAAQIDSHCKLREEQANPSPPTAAKITHPEEQYSAALARLAAATTLEEENAARDDLAREKQAGRFRPLLFIKNRAGDGFLLLLNPEKRDYFVFVNLHSRTSRFASPVVVDGLVDVRTGEVMKFTSTTGALLPLEFGRDYQIEEFIARGRPQSAKLVKAENRYEVHVTFEYEAPRVVPKTFLGVDRGIYALAAISVVDQDGAERGGELVDGRRLRFVQRLEERRQWQAQRAGRRYTRSSRRAMADEAVHTAANRITALAREHGSQVVLEDLRRLTSRTKPRARSNFNRMLNRSQFEKLRNVLTYKLAIEGLPPPRTVSAAFTSQTCPCCGHIGAENRPKRADGDGFVMDRFQCAKCGYAAHADANAARVIALRRIWRAELPAGFNTKPNSELPAELRFEQFLRDRAERRGDGPGDRVRAVGTSAGRGLDGHEDGEVPPRVEETRLSLGLDRTHRRKETSAAMPPQRSSSSEKPPLAGANSDDRADT